MRTDKELNRLQEAILAVTTALTQTQPKCPVADS